MPDHRRRAPRLKVHPWDREPRGPRPDFETATEGWLTAGGPHHTVLSTQLGAEELTDLAEVFDTELVLIDADTTRRSLAKELRCSAAYHRLNQRL